MATLVQMKQTKINEINEVICEDRYPYAVIV